MFFINEYVWSKKCTQFVESLQVWAGDQQADDPSRSSAYFRVLLTESVIHDFKTQTHGNKDNFRIDSLTVF